MIYSVYKHSYRQQWSQKPNRFDLGEGDGNWPHVQVKVGEALTQSDHRGSNPTPILTTLLIPTVSLSVQVWFTKSLCPEVCRQGTEGWCLHTLTGTI